MLRNKEEHCRLLILIHIPVAMDQTPQEMLHSLFSFDPSTAESRGHLYPYNYHYGQYPYPYHYPYPHPHHHPHPHPHPHPTTTPTAIPPPSHTLPPPSPSPHHLTGASQGLVASQSNLSTYGVQGNRHSTGDARQVGGTDRHSLGSQQGAEDLRSDSRTDMRHYRSASSEPRYLVDHLRAISTHSCPATDYRHMSEYSLQPTDLRTQPIESRAFDDLRQLAGDPRPPVNVSRSPEENRHLPSGGGLDTSRTIENFRYPGDLRTCETRNSSSTQELQLPSGDPRPPLNEAISTDNTSSSYGSSPIKTNDSKSSFNQHESNIIKPLNSQGHYDGPDMRIDKTPVSGDDLTAPSYVNNNQCDTPSNMSANNNSLAVNSGGQNTELQDNMSYPAVSCSSSPLGLLSHSLEQHMKQNDFEGGGGGDNNSVNQKGQKVLNTLNSLNPRNADNTCFDGVVNFEEGSGEENEKLDEEEEEKLDDDVDDEDDFDSEASSTDVELSDIAHEVFNESGLSAKPFHCQNCDATFTTKGNLKVHQRIHTGEKPYSCDECDKTFSYCASYQSHKLMHSGHRPYECEFCQRGFFRSEHLERHRRRHTGERPFKCTECDATFAASDGLSRHTRTHTGERPYNCDECGESFAYKSTFLRHKQMHIGEVFKCDECGSGFRDASKLERHVRKHKDPNYVPGSEEDRPNPNTMMEEGVEMTGCEFCQMKFRRKSDYYRHRQTHTGENPYTCDMCNSTFTRRTYLVIHMQTHTGERPYICDTCNSTFKTRKGLRFHKRTHSGEKPYKCQHCNIAFAQKSNLNGHLRIHSGDRPFKCGVCDAAFRHKNSLVIHTRTHTGERPYSCDHCGATFTQKPHLNIHKRSHLGIKPHNCDECDASFTKKDYLLAHKTKHAGGSVIKIEAIVQATGEQVYKCEHCQMIFTHPSSLTVHTRKHTGERPFVCEECGASFLYSSNLTTHRRKHTGERPYKCDQCDSSFILKSYLTMHLRKHSGERPFQCDICQARFTQKTHLSTHRRIHTGECPYKCEECGEAFRDGANFWRHKKKHVVGEGAASIRKRKGKRGRGRGRGRGRVRGRGGGTSRGKGRGRGSGSDHEQNRPVPTRRTTRVPKLVVKFEDLYEQFAIWPEEAAVTVKQEPQEIPSKEQEHEEHTTREEEEMQDGSEEEEHHPYINLNPKVEIKLEDEGMEIMEEEGKEQEDPLVPLEERQRCGGGSEGEERQLLEKILASVTQKAENCVYPLETNPTEHH